MTRRLRQLRHLVCLALYGKSCEHTARVDERGVFTVCLLCDFEERV